ncbi:NAD(P)-binding protein [Penicillium sp. CMV-2018d]|nr:NAD(P)-binding protein [Penicillium sp. CMV-2018d]
MVLDNPTIHDLLINLSQEETIAFRRVLEQTFEDGSVGGERQYQPMPSVANRANGQNTLFRPFTSDSSVGAKIVVEPAPRPDGKKDPPHGIIVLTDGKGNPTAILSSEEVTGYRTSMNAMVPFS